jgi:DnaK suppressor protein
MPVAKRKPPRKFAQFEELINEQRRRLKQRLAAEDGDDLPEQVPEDEAGVATKNLIADLELDTRQRRFKLLSDIELALQRLREGTYGICESCGQEISDRRLQALPWTQLCLECAEKRQGHSCN